MKQKVPDKFYVYELCYPNGTAFYVGKGKRGRIHQHEVEADRGGESVKCQVIRSIWQKGEQVLKRIIYETSDQQEAYQYERQRISQLSALGELTNVSKGIDWNKFQDNVPVNDAEKIKRETSLEPPKVTIRNTEPVHYELIIVEGTKVTILTEGYYQKSISNHSSFNHGAT